jgi:hypothetical protein
MITFFAACAATIWVNLSPYPWNAHDKKTYKRAQYVCGNDYRYKREFPCVKSFTKTDERDYQVICGRGR